MNTQKQRKKIEFHGMLKSREYAAWSSAKCRCNQTNNPSYKNYGARGIRMCQEWSDSFPRFYADMGPRPSPDHSLDRIDTNGHYEPSNCRWATHAEQMNNRTFNRPFTLNGETLNLSAWAARLGISITALSGRIERGWPLERALTNGRMSQRDSIALAIQVQRAKRAKACHNSPSSAAAAD